MKCPNCPDTTLAISERQGIELDYCPQCRGVWLDRGKLDKLIDRASASRAVSPQHLDDSYGAQHDSRQGEHHGRRPDDHGQRRAHDRQGGHGRRRKSWFGDLFD